MKEKGRATYYKMLESVRQDELIQVRRGLYANIEQLSNNMIDIERLYQVEFFASGLHGAYVSLRLLCHKPII